MSLIACIVSGHISKIKDFRNMNLMSSTLHSDIPQLNNITRWLKTVLSSSGLDSNMYTAHSFRGTAASVAFSSGVSMKDIMDTANWTSTKAFVQFFHKDLPVNNNDFATNVLDY
uniref:Tyr recombinase domain-containing protein n=1 Tax=Magallana gigas TaxID=29159 RepID=A0A8W8NI59_MAGGI